MKFELIFRGVDDGEEGDLVRFVQSGLQVNALFELIETRAYQVI